MLKDKLSALLMTPLLKATPKPSRRALSTISEETLREKAARAENPE